MVQSDEKSYDRSRFGCSHCFVFSFIEFHLVSFQKESSYAVIEHSFHALKWAHDFSDVENLCVNSVLTAAKKLYGSPVDKKKVLTSEDITKMFTFLPLNAVDLYKLRT
jgi:hypothetical protein